AFRRRARLLVERPLAQAGGHAGPARSFADDVCRLVEERDAESVRVCLRMSLADASGLCSRCTNPTRQRGIAGNEAEERIGRMIMAPTVAELMRALPDESEAAAGAALRQPVAALRPVPTGRWRRLRLLGTLQARIAAAYLFYWIRGWVRRADQNER